MLDFLFPDLRTRNTADLELMDRTDADITQLLRTVRQFRLINRLFSGSRRILRRQVFSIMEQDPAREYSLLDVGAGGCDIAQWVACEARRRSLRLRVTALDNDPRIFPVARETVRGFPEIRLVEGNALNLRSMGPFDFVFSNHFLHHLGWDEIAAFLQGVDDQTRLVWVMNDLRRSRWAYLGGTLGIGLLTRRSFAFADGRLSIQRGFLSEELRDFLENRLPGCPVQVLEMAPARVVLVGRKLAAARAEGTSG